MSLFQSFPNLGKENYGLFHNFVSLLVRNASLRFPDTGSKKLITLVDTGTKMSPKYIMAFHMRKRFRGKAVMSRMVTRLHPLTLSITTLLVTLEAREARCSAGTEVRSTSYRYIPLTEPSSPW